MILKVISYLSSYLNLEMSMCTANETKYCTVDIITEVIRNWNIKTWGRDLQGHLSPPVNEWRIQTADCLATANVLFLRDIGTCTWSLVNQWHWIKHNSNKWGFFLCESDITFFLLDFEFRNIIDLELWSQKVSHAIYTVGNNTPFNYYSGKYGGVCIWRSVLPLFESKKGMT